MEVIKTCVEFRYYYLQPRALASANHRLAPYYQPNFARPYGYGYGVTYGLGGRFPEGYSTPAFLGTSAVERASRGPRTVPVRSVSIWRQC